MRLHYLQGMIPTEDDEAEEQVLEVIDGTKEYLELNRSGTNSCYMYSTGNIHPVVRLFSGIQLHLCLSLLSTLWQLRPLLQVVSWWGFVSSYSAA